MHRVTSKTLTVFDVSYNIIFQFFLKWWDIWQYMYNDAIYALFLRWFHVIFLPPLETANAIILPSIALHSAIRFIILPYPSVRFAVAIRNSNLSNVSHNWAIIAPVIIKYERRDSGAFLSGVVHDCSQEIRISFRGIKFSMRMARSSNASSSF